MGVSPPNLPPIIPGSLLHSFDSAGDNNNEGGINFSYLTNDDDDCRGPFDAAAMPSSRALGGSEKQKAGAGANPKRSHAFSQLLKKPKKSSLGNSKDGKYNNSFSFGHMMSYMMYHNRVELEQRDCQNRIDSERREHEYELHHEELAVQQNRIDSERREHEYELHHEELAVQHKENCAQRQLMNVMMMAILNKKTSQRTIVHPTIAL